MNKTEQKELLVAELEAAKMQAFYTVLAESEDVSVSTRVFLYQRIVECQNHITEYLLDHICLWDQNLDARDEIHEICVDIIPQCHEWLQTGYGNLHPLILVLSVEKLLTAVKLYHKNYN